MTHVVPAPIDLCCSARRGPTHLPGTDWLRRIDGIGHYLALQVAVFAGKAVAFRREDIVRGRSTAEISGSTVLESMLAIEPSGRMPMAQEVLPISRCPLENPVGE